MKAEATLDIQVGKQPKEINREQFCYKTPVLGLGDFEACHSIHLELRWGPVVTSTEAFFPW